MQIRELMTGDPVSCTPDTDLQRVAEMMVQHDIGAIPVVENNDPRRPLGMVTDRDIVTRGIATGNNPLQMRARDVMTENVVAIKADADLEEAKNMMEENQIRRLIVANDDGKSVGIVAQADLALHASDDVTAEVVERVSEPSQEASVPSQG